MIEDISQKKLDLIELHVGNLPGYIQRLVDKRPDQYVIKKEVWRGKCNEMKTILGQPSYFLFIGKFSSGKSSFVNALIGKDILPTNSRPTTAVVTEVVFKREGVTNGNVHYIDDDREETKSKEEILEIIQGKTKINIGAVHHVTLSININDKSFGEDFEENFRPLVDKVVLVDCPGFDSPYKFSENVLYEYVVKSSFTYYFFPADDFGSLDEIKRLKKIRNNTATLIPIISKRDKIENKDAENEIRECFEKMLADSFPEKEPVFVSTFKFKEKQAKELEFQEKIISDTLSDEEQRLLNDLEQESGVQKMFNVMTSAANRNALNQQKIASVKLEFNDTVSEIKASAQKELEYWERELVNKIHYDFDSKEYKDLNRSNELIKGWIENQAVEASKKLKNDIVIKVTNHLSETSGHPKEAVIKEIYNNCFNDLFSANKEKWTKQFNEYFKEVSLCFNGESNFEPPKIDFGLSVGYLFEGILNGVKAEPILWAAGGATLLGAKSIVASLTIDAMVTSIAIGSVLAPIVATAGIALLGVAGVKGFNPMRNAIKESKAKREREIQSKVDYLLSQNTNFMEVIHKVLEAHREMVYEQAFNARKSEKDRMLANYDDSKNLVETLDTLQNNLNDKIS